MKLERIETELTVCKIKDPALADLEGRAIKSAGIVLCTLPIMCFYPFLQKFFVTGIVVGSVKG